MYDNTCKFLAEEFSTDIASWLLGEPIDLVELSPKELSIEPIRVDSLILRQSADIVLHAEFQTESDEEMPFRMADYRLRVYRRYPQKRMFQVVIYLRKTASALVYQDTFSLETTEHRFNIIRLWEQPTEIFFSYPGLLPFAVLSQKPEKVDILRNVARQVATMTNRKIQSNISASAALLAGLVLKEREINQILRSDIMKESVMYQAIRRDAIAEGRAEGQREEKEKIALNLLLSGMSPQQVMEVTELSLERIQQLQKQQEVS